MVEAARRYGRVVQTGSEARSKASCRFACELVRNGRIGEVQGGVRRRRGRAVEHGDPAGRAGPAGPGLGHVARPGPVAPVQQGLPSGLLAGLLRFLRRRADRLGRASFRPGPMGPGHGRHRPGRNHPARRARSTSSSPSSMPTACACTTCSAAQPDVEMLSSVTIIGTEGRVGLRYGGIREDRSAVADEGGDRSERDPLAPVPAGRARVRRLPHGGAQPQPARGGRRDRPPLDHASPTWPTSPTACAGRCAGTRSRRNSPATRRPTACAPGDARAVDAVVSKFRGQALRTSRSSPTISPSRGHTLRPAKIEV